MYQVFPNYANAKVSQADHQKLSGCEKEHHTFSRPKNLSVPLSLIGPAFCSIFSRGVSSGAGSSFLFFGEALLVAFELPWSAESYQHDDVVRRRWKPRGIATKGKATGWCVCTPICRDLQYWQPLTC